MWNMIFSTGSKYIQAVSPAIFCQTELSDSAFSKCVQKVSVIWHCLLNCTGWQGSFKMCPVCECDLGCPAKLDWLTVLFQNVSREWVWPVIFCQTGLTVLSQNVSRLWVWPGISCQTGLAEIALSKCVQEVSMTISCQTGLDWQCSLKMCPGCECNLGFPAKLDWLILLFENVSRKSVWPGISCQTGLADITLSKCVQKVSATWYFPPNWTSWQCSLKMCPESECNLGFPAKLDWLTVLSQNVSRLWVWSGISCQTGLADSALSKCVQEVSVIWYLPNWTSWQCSLKMCPGSECNIAFPVKLDWLTVLFQNVSS